MFVHLKPSGGGREECNGLLAVLTNHPELGAKVAEVIASFAREGVQ